MPVKLLMFLSLLSAINIVLNHRFTAFSDFDNYFWIW